MISDPTTLSREELIRAWHERERVFGEQLLERERSIRERERIIADAKSALVERQQVIADREQVIADHQQIIADREQVIADHQQTILQKEYIIAKLQRMLYGSRRERFTVPDGQQVLAFLVDAERMADAVKREQQSIHVEYTRAASKKHPGRLPLPEHLPVEEIIHEPDVDTSGMRCIGRETSQELVFVPGSFHIRRHVRPKYVTPENEDLDQSVIVAPLPPRAIPRCIASDELLAELIVSKHVYHLPIYRQLQQFAALGVKLPSSTVDSWQRLLGLRLRPLYAAMRELIGQSTYLQVDETAIAVQDRDKKGTTHRGYMWAYHAPIDRVVYFDYQSGRGAINCTEMLSSFSGYLQTDGYAAYKQHKARDEVVPLACWAHVRRKFHEALENDRVRAEAMLAMIGALYDVEREARERGLSSLERKELRLCKSHPVTTAIGQWLVRAVKVVTPKSPIGAAVGYAIALWDELENYLHDGHLEIDNNLVENAIRPLALGRKNYLFAGSHDAAVNIAMYRSFFASCRSHDIDPRRWMVHVLGRIATTPAAEYHTLLPHAIVAELHVADAT